MSRFESEGCRQICERGVIGKRIALKMLRETVWVRVPPLVPAVVVRCSQRRRCCCWQRTRKTLYKKYPTKGREQSLWRGDNSIPRTTKEKDDFMTTYETRRESNKKVDRQKRYNQILHILKGRTMTAKEVAVEMNRRGLTPTSERNFAAPRLTELVNDGLVEVVGKRKCQYCHKMVAQYKLV